MKHHDYIAVLDFGSQFAHLIARRVRQLGVLAKIFTPDTPAHSYATAKGIILSGGPKSTIAADAVPYDPGLFTLGIPTLGLCYGHQLVALHFGGQVAKGKTKEYGQADVQILDTTDPLVQNLGKTERVWMSHWDVVTKAPAGFEVIGATKDCPIAIIRQPHQRIWSCQFHVEVQHTAHGLEILRNFVIGICQVTADWNTQAIEDEIITDIQRTVPPGNQVFLLVSGGVDSTVAFALLEKALGKNRVYGLHVDNGFMRLRESVKVMAALRRAGFDNLHMVDASSRFLRIVQGVTDPEVKRQRIGELFVEIANEEMITAVGDSSIDTLLLGQGTIYPDTIESGGTQHADKIKTHHNQIDLIQELTNQGKVVEPLRSVYKDEVRAIGKRLKLAKGLLERKPFPGPGLAIRILCSTGDNTITNENKINRQLQHIVQRVNRRLQAHVLPMKSVGVQGDERSYKHPVVIIGQASWKQLNELSVRITNEVFVVNRVLWLVYPQAIMPAAIMQERYLTQDRVDLLRVIDDQVTQHVTASGISPDIWQFPVVLVPFGNRNTEGESIVLRPIQSQEAMTVNFYPMPKTTLTAICRTVKKNPYIDYIFYDITNKPPATIEWE